MTKLTAPGSMQKVCECIYININSLPFHWTIVAPIPPPMSSMTLQYYCNYDYVVHNTSNIITAWCSFNIPHNIRVYI